ncbi:mechanosensitive ion channel family protein [Chryseolinea lacunae]|uniref:Mechanosensitive ion channel family protein n=1 Tax=Chryseolinea lacunae TaxID=2801331 RepID=A0ABS1KZQ3_9BACT|nr:mechanosensitive ion channel family protein [Chryseolinea lacunae]MBL0744717.1 mechanosensitive ion channel family protein [Chryseolinea lacunae]
MAIERNYSIPMESSESILARQYWGNTVQAYLIALGIAVLGLFLLRIFKRFILSKVEKWVAQSPSKVDDEVVKGVERFVLPMLGFLLVYWGIKTLELSLKAERVLEVATAVVIAFFVLRFISTSIHIILTSYIRKQENGETKVLQVGGLMMIINIVVWILGGLFLFQNLGYDVSTILTGVGIGGIAVALAAQNIIGDLFNYFVIFFDKPFEVGDAINVDDKNGTIEYIGVKTTRLRSLTGEQIIIANSDLTKSRVHNFKRQESRRVQFTINVVYETPTDKLREIPGIIKSIIESADDVRFDRAHLAKLTDYGIGYEVVYFVTVADYLKYMDIQQEVNIKLMETFAHEGIRFLIRDDWPRTQEQSEAVALGK